jgi:5-methylcytosine-specific restriction protein B
LTPSQRLSEREFFDRFVVHVDAEGFSYRDIDLKAFHLLVKCGDMTVLGGLSGTGKSSLVRLYAEALAGDDEAARGRLLTVDVSPSWTEPQDLIGSVNLLDRCFEPATSGLFGHIVQAVREYERVGNRAGMVLVALDEMNLAQVEHYLTGLFQALERPHPRRVRVFDRSALRPDDPLREFAELLLPPTLKLIGTVNFDETTRPLSQRLKDRAAIMELGSTRHAGLQAPRPSGAPIAGPPVLLADMQAWLGQTARMPQEVAEAISGLMDQLNRPLLGLGAPVTPRRMQAIRGLLVAGTELLSSEELLDLAMLTRVLPLLRGLDRPTARKDAGEILDLLTEAPGGCPESRGRLSEMLRDAKVEWQGMVEDE